MPDAFVSNAADAGQVKGAKKAERFERRRQLDDLRALLESEPARRFLWRVMEYCALFESIYSDGEAIRYHAGRQDVGRFILGELTQADERAFIKLMEQNLRETRRHAPDRSEENQDGE